MHEYYPKWDNKFGSESYTRLYATYINNTTTEMKWNLSSAYFPFSDPDNFVSKTPETILQILFNES
jgi:hypothetical protein